METHFTDEETRALVRSLATGEGEPVSCPRCAEEMSRSEVPPRHEVSYVRDRIWLVCRGCGRTAVLDRRRVERVRSEGPEGESG